MYIQNGMIFIIYFGFLLWIFNLILETFVHYIGNELPMEF